MLIKFEYKDNKDFENAVNVYANDVSIGILHSINGPENLSWDIYSDMLAVKFALRKKEIFYDVVNELKKYKDEMGYKYLVITAYRGVASFFKMETLHECGFWNKAGGNPEIFYLE